MNFSGILHRLVWARFLLLSLWSIPSLLHAQTGDPGPGPVIEKYGPVYEIEGAWGLETDVVYRALFDVSGSPDNPAELNRAIESAARFLNMSARAGVPPTNLQLALVLHGSAGKDTLSNAAYRMRFGFDNPNDGLLNALKEAGVAIYLCGQTAGFRSYQASELHSTVTMATSAMTVLTRLQAEGWSLLP